MSRDNDQESFIKEHDDESLTEEQGESLIKEQDENGSVEEKEEEGHVNVDEVEQVEEAVKIEDVDAEEKEIVEVKVVGKEESVEKDVEVAKEIKSKQTAGGVALWAVNPTPSAKNNASVWCNDTAWALKDVMKASFVYGNAPNYTRSDNGWWPGSTGDMDEEAVMV